MTTAERCAQALRELGRRRGDQGHRAPAVAAQAGIPETQARAWLTVLRTRNQVHSKNVDGHWEYWL
jgi:hypothetical protein